MREEEKKQSNIPHAEILLDHLRMLNNVYIKHDTVEYYPNEKDANKKYWQSLFVKTLEEIKSDNTPTNTKAGEIRSEFYKRLHRELKHIISGINNEKPGSVEYWIKLYSDYLIQEVFAEVIVNDIINNNTNPADQIDWIENEYKENRDKYNTDNEWASKTALKFKSVFSTKRVPSATSMKRYGIYGGFN